ncbi:MAG: ABC transporter ATP-binding protein [Acidimicrobiales bacterium]
MTDAGSATPLLQVEGLTKAFRTGYGFLGGRARMVAVDRVSFDVEAGETFGLVGESGSGKTTAARMILRLLAPDAGSIRLGGVDALSLRGDALKRFRRSVQIVFQDPYSSLDPTWSIFDSVAEPLRAHGIVSGTGALGREVATLLGRVGLDAKVSERYPRELSGGQRQRVAMARALALRPQLLVCDEPVSALDVSTQAQLVSLLAGLQAELGLAVLFIAHDLLLIRQISRRIAVMLFGRLVEVGPADEVYHRPAHPYTQALISAVPVADPIRQRQRRRVTLAGDAGSRPATAQGCPFQHRCPAVMDVCRVEDPPLLTIGPGRQAACHALTTAPVATAAAPPA